MFRRSKSIKKTSKQIEVISHSKTPGDEGEQLKVRVEDKRKSVTVTVETERLNCLCCGMVLDIPRTAEKFKCCVCHVTTYRGGQTKSETYKYKTSIDVDDLAVIVKNCFNDIVERKNEMTQEEKYNVFNPVNDYIDAKFRHHQILENSFPGSSPLVDSDVNTEQVLRFYKILFSLPTRRPYFRMLCRMNDLLRKANHNCTHFRWLIIILMNPGLRCCLIGKAQGGFDSQEIRTISYELLKRSIGYLSNLDRQKHSKKLIKYLMRMPLSCFKEQLEVLNLYLTFQFSKIMYKDNQSVRTRIQPRRMPSDGMELVNNSTYWNYHLSGSDESPNINGILESKSSEHGQKGKSVPSGDFKFSPYQYENDWHILSVTKLISFFFTANQKRNISCLQSENNGLLDTSTFYNTILDFIDYRKDFDNWRGKPNRLHFVQSKEYDGNGKQLTFCKYPFLISLGLKISIMEYEIRRIMEYEAEQAFLLSLDKGKVIDVYLKVRVRRSNISSDSLQSIKEHQGDLFKSLKVEFVGEPGIDAGGLRKEWFMLLTKTLFDPRTSLFVYVPESRLIWFSNSAQNEASIPDKETMELYYLFGVVMALAIFNSTILNLHFPKALYKKICGEPLKFDDYAEIYPETAQNLQKLLEYDGDDFSEVFALNFETTFINDMWEINPKNIKKYNTVELCANGKNMSVTSSNKEEYVKLWIDFYLNKNISTTFEKFLLGFKRVFSVSKSIKLFNFEELQRLVCGDQDTNKYDFGMLKSVTKYIGGMNENMPVAKWFWEIAQEWDITKQKKLMRFVTGSDGVPATGMSTLPFKLSLLGSSDSDKLPIAHTCFNELCLWQYRSKEKLESKLKWAVTESEGFGFK